MSHLAVTPRRKSSGLTPKRQSLTKQKRSASIINISRSNTMQVILRVRPSTQKELRDIRNKEIIEIVNRTVVIFDPKEPEDPFYVHGKKQAFRDITKKVNKNLQFNFDRVFGAEDSTYKVYQESIQSVIGHLLNGYNCTVFAYGATGAGKTHTMLGTQDTPGVTPQLMTELYAALQEVEDTHIEVLVSYLEIYNEIVYDLLVAKPQDKPLALQDCGPVVQVNNLSWHKPASSEELMAMLQEGNLRRSQSPTDANAESSRSHAVFQLMVKMKQMGSNTGQVQVAKLNMIDLAGSERAAATTNSQMRFIEGANINTSLLALGNCINALADGCKFVPFRNSKLTRLLKGSLGGNCQTIMIANISPSGLVENDTYNTLKYATRAKKIKNKAKKNVSSEEITAADYKKYMERHVVVVAELQQKILELQESNKEIEQLREENAVLRRVNPNALLTRQATEEGPCKCGLQEEVVRLRSEVDNLRGEHGAAQELLATYPQLASSILALTKCTSELKTALEQRQVYQGNIVDLSYNLEKKTKRKDMVHALDSLNTSSCKAIQIKYSTQIKHFKEMLKVAKIRCDLLHNEWDVAVSNLMSELGKKVALKPEQCDIILKILYDGLMDSPLTNKQLQGFDSLKNNDLNILQEQCLKCATLLRKCYYALHANKLCPRAIEAEFENLKSFIRQPSNVTLPQELDEPLAEPLPIEQEQLPMNLCTTPDKITSEVSIMEKIKKLPTIFEGCSTSPKVAMDEVTEDIKPLEMYIPEVNLNETVCIGPSESSVHVSSEKPEVLPVTSTTPSSYSMLCVPNVPVATPQQPGTSQSQHTLLATHTTAKTPKGDATPKLLKRPIGKSKTSAKRRKTPIRHSYKKARHSFTYKENRICIFKKPLTPNC